MTAEEYREMLEHCCKDCPYWYTDCYMVPGYHTPPRKRGCKECPFVKRQEERRKREEARLRDYMAKEVEWGRGVQVARWKLHDGDRDVILADDLGEAIDFVVRNMCLPPDIKVVVCEEEGWVEFEWKCRLEDCICGVKMDLGYTYTSDTIDESKICLLPRWRGLVCKRCPLLEMFLSRVRRVRDEEGN